MPEEKDFKVIVFRNRIISQSSTVQYRTTSRAKALEMARQDISSGKLDNNEWKDFDDTIVYPTLTDSDIIGSNP